MNILLIEDSVSDAMLVKAQLQSAAAEHHTVSHVTRLDEGMQELRHGCWDAVLLDLGLPEAQGLDSLRLLRTASGDVPIIVLTGLDDDDAAMQAVELGAHDFLEKHRLAGQTLVRSLRYAQERNRLLLAMRHLALHDPLTGLFNRKAFDERIQRIIAEAEVCEEPFILMFFDLDGFKLVNDLGGHDVGDQLLVDVAARLKCLLRDGDMLARLGGDEFAALIFGVADHASAEQVARRFHAAFDQPFHIGTRRMVVSTSIGIVAGDDVDRTDPSMIRAELLRDADMAMYAAKSAGRGRTQFYDASMRESLIDQACIEDALREVVAAEELHLRYQPIVHLETREIVALEALCRWEPPGRSPIPPDVFIPIAEKTGLINSIGRWVLKQACQDFARWKSDNGNSAPGARLHVNMSRYQLTDGTLVETIEEALRQSGIPPHELTMEVTESCMIGDDKLAMSVFTRIQSLGVGLAIDDFGVGYSSLGHLRRFPFDSMKIDRSFVAQLEEQDGAPAVLLEAISTLAASLGLTTIVEGVETEGQARKLADIGYQLAQGFLFAAADSIDRVQMSDRLVTI